MHTHILIASQVLPTHLNEKKKREKRKLSVKIIYRNRHSVDRSSYWAPAPQPLIYHPAKIQLIDQKLSGIDKRSLTFTLTGEHLYPLWSSFMSLLA